MDLIKQRKNVTAMYDDVASVYDKDFEGKADYRAPEILINTFKKHNIYSGKILDIGCGTGKLKSYLGNGFEYIGIDISPKMVAEAQKKYSIVYLGSAEEVIKTIPDKSVDHIVALSSLYFIDQFDGLLGEIERIARKSFFMTLEQFTPEIIEMMNKKGIELYNHPILSVINPTEIFQNIYLWKRPNTEDKIHGDVVFKKFD